MLTRKLVFRNRKLVNKLVECVIIVSVVLLLSVQLLSLPRKRTFSSGRQNSSTDLIARDKLVYSKFKPSEKNDSTVKYQTSVYRFERPEHFTEDYIEESEVEHNATFALWKQTGDQQCSQYRTAFGQNLPLRGLFSFPSSGSSWTRYLLEAASGVFTGSEYRAESLVQVGMLGELAAIDSGWTLIQKSHGFSVDPRRDLHMVDMARLGCGYVLLLRHPADAIVGTRHLDAAWQTGFAAASQFSGADWQKYLHYLAETWLDFNMERLHACPKEHMHVVIYEQLVKDPLRELRLILKFIGVDPSSGRMVCVKKFPNGSMKRNHSLAPSIPHAFTMKDKTLLHKYVRTLNTALEMKGFPQIPYKWNFS